MEWCYPVSLVPNCWSTNDLLPKIRSWLITKGGLGTEATLKTSVPLDPVLASPVAPAPQAICEPTRLAQQIESMTVNLPSQTRALFDLMPHLRVWTNTPFQSGRNSKESICSQRVFIRRAALSPGQFSATWAKIRRASQK